MLTSPFTGLDLEPILDLGMHAYADTFIPADRLTESEPVFPLQLGLESATGLVQVTISTPAKDRYGLYDYSYTSANSRFSREHWQEQAAWLDMKFKVSNKSVLEVGSNDGFLLCLLRDRGAKVLGIDASPAMVEHCRGLGITCQTGLFGEDAATDMIPSGTVDLVISNNVVNHSNRLLDFAREVDRVLAADGSWTFEVPYWADIVEHNRWDTIYHEHVTYFTVRSVRRMLESIGMRVDLVSRIDYHGGSLRVVASRGHRHDRSLHDLELYEQQRGLFDPRTYAEWWQKVIQRRDDFLRRLLQWRVDHPDGVVIGVGAAAKANTLLTVYRMDPTLINFVTDASDSKKGKYTPLTRIPIRGDDEFGRHHICAAVILSWNIADSLREQVLRHNTNTEFLTL